MTRRTVQLLMYDADLHKATGITRYALSLSEALAALPGQRIDFQPKAIHPSPSAPEVEPAGVPRWQRYSWFVRGAPTYRVGAVDALHLLAPTHPVPAAVPTLMTVHDVMPLTRPDWFPRAQVFAFRRTMSWARDHVARFIAVSTWTADQLRQHGGISADRISVIGEGVGSGLAGPSTECSGRGGLDAFGLERGGYLLTIGATHPRKNLDVLAQAAAAARVPLVLVGPSPERLAKVAPRLADLVHERRVRCLGAVSDAVLHTLIARALGLVHPAFCEGFGLTVLEAMSIGTPVIASTGGALPEIVGDSGLLVDPGDPAAWVEAVVRIQRDEELRHGLSESGRQQASLHSWDRVAHEMSLLYETLLPR